ncbi:uncharacterized protein LOC118756725, partial [Rhagoletis pomonella]|uniref:uncharacterized protein LOC118756725 n=1 Tax=Rhagoletis pomonella TaxID=28610 RepID=UPI00177C7D31
MSRIECHTKVCPNEAQIEYRELAERIPIDCLMELFDQMKTRIRKAMKEKYKELKGKLKKLQTSQEGVNKKQREKPEFHARFVNLTEVLINKEESRVLEKGLKHNIQNYNKEKEIEQTIVDAEIAISMLPKEEQEHTRHRCKQLIEKEIKAKGNKNHSKESNIIKGLKQKLKNNNVITTKADKGNTTVLMNRDEYIQKTEQLIKETRCRKLAKDPTEEYQATIKETIKKATKIIKPNQIHTLTIMNPSAPPMNALPKIHKLGTPMRPIINHRSAPSYKLSKHLKTILKDNLRLPNKYTISNTTELIEKIKDSAITMDTKLVSFDIKDLYPSIPITETIDIVFKILIEKTGNREIAVEITNTLRTTLHQNYFKFNNNIYMQTNGLGMGNPTSAILMEVFMQNLEE